MEKTDLKLLGTNDACKLLNVSATRFNALIKKYDIPYYLTSAGKIFLEADIKSFQEDRRKKGLI